MPIVARERLDSQREIGWGNVVRCRKVARAQGDARHDLKSGPLSASVAARAGALRGLTRSSLAGDAHEMKFDRCG